jgi:hypothetical protein
MKFRRTCSVCNATFFSPDRKAAYCLKCVKKKIVKHVPAEARTPVAQPARATPRAIPRPVAPPRPVRKQKVLRPPKVAEMTPELRERILQAYREEYNGQAATREVHNKIAEKVWAKRQLVADVLRDITKVNVVLSAEEKQRAIEMYQRFVETGHRPEGGRRRAISVALGVPFKQVVKAIRDWSLSQYSKSPTPTPSRIQLFEIEKIYWNELHEKRYGLRELPDRIAEQLGYVTRWQVLRWLDVLHDDERAFAKVPDPEPEVQEEILKAYREYLSSNEPPEQGLHYTIAGRFEHLTPRQVHKVLQSYRHRVRAEYPLL